MKVIRIASKGDGVTADGRHVRLAVPGDEVGDDGILIPGPHHVSPPPCRHFPICGGCQLQHADDAVYRDYLVSRVADALAAQGIADVEIGTPHLSPPHTRRRVSLTAERAGKRVVLGFNEAASHRIVDVADCPMMHPDLFALVAPLRALFAAILPPKARGRVMMTRVDQGVDVLISGFEVEGLAAIEALTGFGATHRLARLSVDEGYGPGGRWMPEPVTVTLSGTAVTLPDGAFLQATADGEAALVTAVRVGVGDAAQIADLFAGLGTFALALDGKVHAVEGARDAILSLAATRRVATEHRDLFRRPLTPQELARFDAVILDPPRAGASEQAAALAASTVRRIAYVSCNPATFARDARTLIDGGYRLPIVMPVGQFRWSTHVELVGRFTRL